MNTSNQNPLRRGGRSFLGGVASFAAAAAVSGGSTANAAPIRRAPQRVKTSRAGIKKDRATFIAGS